MAKSWEELGKRVQSARKDVGLTPLELASALGVESADVTLLEGGQRTVDPLELSRIARVLRRPIGWFVTDPPASIVSRRQGRGDVVRQEDLLLEVLAQDVEQLVELGVLQPVEHEPATIDTLADAEVVARDARRRAGLKDDEPAWNLVTLAERLGLYAFVLELSGQTASSAEGSYVALQKGGVALIGNIGDSGRRRFTIAHELGHHVLADEFAAEWTFGAGATDREKVINAFAIHFLLPRAAVEQRWRTHGGAADPRDAAIRIAVEFGLSWSAACAQLDRLGSVTRAQHDALIAKTPTRFELLERELTIRSDVDAPLVPPGFAAAVARALGRSKISSRRALELLHGTLSERDLPVERVLSLESMTAELDGLPA